MKSNKWKFLMYGFGSLIIVWGIIYILPVDEKEKHTYFENDRPLVMAHQGGSALAPSSTMAAFLLAEQLGVDVIEFDVHMTKDGYLVAIHDDTVDRTTDGSGKVNDLTLADIQSLDAGAHYQDENGHYSYQGKGVSIPTVREIFTAIPNMRWNIEIKDSNDPELYRIISEKLWGLMVDFDVEEDVLVVSFDQEIVDIVTEVSNGQAIVAAGRQEVTKFVLLHKLFLNGLYRSNIDAIEIPTEEGFIKLDDSKLIEAAGKHGIDVHYWTINDRETMHHLLDIGADGIITDHPDVLLDVLAERGY